MFCDAGKEQMMQALLIFLVAMTPKGEICEHADAILSKQLADGAIIHQQSGDQITISPYFGNYAALGLFEAYQITDDKKYRRRNQVDGLVFQTHGSPGRHS